PAGQAAEDLPGLRAGRQLDDAPLRRDGARAVDCLAPGGPDGRPGHGRERGRPRQLGCFYPPLPAAAASPRRSPHPAPRRPARHWVARRGLRVLVIDDNAPPRRLVGEWLRGWQAEPTAVPDGLTALDALWRGAAQGRPYALVLLDARMPGCDGLALAAKLSQ